MYFNNSDKEIIKENEIVSNSETEIDVLEKRDNVTIEQEERNNKKKKDFFYYFNRIIIGIVILLVLVLTVSFTIFDRMMVENSEEEFENVANEEVSMTDQEVLDYISEEINKIFIETKKPIFLTETDNPENEFAITGLQLGNTQPTGEPTHNTYFLNYELQNMGVVVALKDDKISDILVNVVYSGKYYILIYTPQYGVVGGPDEMSNYLGQITYNVDINNYSNVTFKSDERYDATYGSLQYYTGDDSIMDVSGGYFKASMSNGNFTDVEFFRGNRSIDINSLDFNYQLKK